jgi:hypothetical protein
MTAIRYFDPACGALVSAVLADSNENDRFTPADIRAARLSGENRCPSPAYAISYLAEIKVSFGTKSHPGCQ